MKKILSILSIASLLMIGCKETDDFRFSIVDLYGTWDGTELYHFPIRVDLANNPNYGGYITFNTKEKCEGAGYFRNNTYNNVNGTYTVQDKTIFINAHYDGARISGRARVTNFDRKNQEAELSVTIDGTEVQGVTLKMKKR